ncbi:MAG: HAD family hydrolase [Actinomycetota bacterium]|jgi:2-haloacid dehalogenase
MTTFSDVRLLSFDCYGTLIDWEFGITEVVTRLAKPHGVHPTEQEILSLFASHETHVQDANPTWTYPVILAETWRRMADSLGLPSRTTNADQCERDAHAFASSVPTWPAFPDSHQALLDLQRQCKLVILSNVDNASFAGSNARLGVTFDAILTAQDIGSYKPDLHNFRMLLEKAHHMGVSPDQHLHVAQSLFHDHVPAQAVGLRTVWINRYGAKRKAAGSLGATPAAAPVTPNWEYPTLRAFADALLAVA